MHVPPSSSGADAPLGRGRTYQRDPCSGPVLWGARFGRPSPQPPRILLIAAGRTLLSTCRPSVGGGQLIVILACPSARSLFYLVRRRTWLGRSRAFPVFSVRGGTIYVVALIFEPLRRACRYQARLTLYFECREALDIFTVPLGTPYVFRA